MRPTLHPTFIGRWGPWLSAYPIPNRSALDGSLAAARLTVSRDSGLFVNVAAVGVGSWIVGWYPHHRRCMAQPYRHHCLWSWLPHITIETQPVTAPTRVPQQAS